MARASEAGRGVGAAGETPTMGVVVESRTDPRSTSRLALWFSVERLLTCSPGGVMRPRRAVRFARLIDRADRRLRLWAGLRPAAALGGHPAVRHATRWGRQHPRQFHQGSVKGAQTRTWLVTCWFAWDGRSVR